MTFPSIEQYTDALQLPQHTMLDPHLASGTVETNTWGLPFGRSGGFALTFKITTTAGDYAFRCFQSERPTMHERYTAISQSISRASLPYFVAFEYLDPGIRVQQNDFPAIRMEWAQGLPLGVYVEQLYRDSGRMRALQQQLHGMALALEGAGIAHGDIQTGNILVGPSGDLKLVDYDGMFVPALAHLGAIETGHPNFQHAQRVQLKPYDASLDRFSFALLHSSLSALIESPSLWTTLKSDPEALLFRASDLANPAASEAFRVLTKLPGSGAVHQRLLAVASSSYTQVPTFSDFLSGRNIPTPPVAAAPASSSQPQSAAAAAGVSSQKVTSRNAATLQGLSSAGAPAKATAQPPQGQAPGVAANLPQPNYTPPARATGGSLNDKLPWLVPTLGIAGLVVVLLMVALVAVIADQLANGSGSAGKPGVSAPLVSPEQTAAPSPTSDTPAGEEPTAEDMVGTCWAESPSDPTIIDPVECASVEAVLRAASVARNESACPGEWLPWGDEDVLCLETWPPVVYETCVKPQGEPQYCETGLSWTYSGCWDGARGVVLEQRVGGEWKTVKTGISQKNNCDSGFPWTVEFTRKAAGPGTKEYRLYFPASDGFTTTIEPITVTVRVEE